MALVGKEQAIAKHREVVNSEWGRTCQAFHDVTMGKIMPECVEECPVDQGTLQASIPACSHVVATPTQCVATIGAGGAAAAYAYRQHEDLTLHHPAMTRAPGTLHSRNVAMAKYGGGITPVTYGKKAKYIEDPVLRNAPNVPAMVAARKGQL